METKLIISWLYDKAARAQDHSYARMLNMAAKRLNELDQPQNQNTGYWIIRSSGKGRNATNWAECSVCHVCGSPQWKVCPVCETRMEKYNAINYREENKNAEN